MAVAPVIMWFRQDLRLSDNPAFTEAARRAPVIPLYILDGESPGPWAMGGASRWWLHQSLTELDRSLDGRLVLQRGSPLDVLRSLVASSGARAVFWNRCYEPWRTERDARIKRQLKADGVDVESCNGSLLWEPWEVLKADGTPYRVFTPFYRRGCLGGAEPRSPLPAPATFECRSDPSGVSLDDLALLTEDVAWHRKLESSWEVGERAAGERLEQFIEQGLAGYGDGRDFPGRPYHGSRLSPHLHFGEISPHAVWHAVRTLPPGEDQATFCKELAWREFSYQLLYHNPDLPETNLQARFDDFPWRTSDAELRCWQTGRTGHPLVDAGMRELWATGYMHNRVRMVAASFLIKNLLIDWREGERWFWDCLVDADLANNAASWQWVAGSGADAAPYFRVFNPAGQGKKFDPDGAYTRRWVPELGKLPDRYLFEPWTAPQDVLKAAGVELGVDYPEPLVDLKSTRLRALDAWQTIRG